MWYFFRYVVVYFVFLPLAIAANLYIAIAVNPPRIGFDETVFWVVLGLTLLSVTLWLSTICFYQAYIHFVLISNSVLLAYFVADTQYSANLLLGSLVVHLSTIYDMVTGDATSRQWHILSALRWEYAVMWRDAGSIAPDLEHRKCRLPWREEQTLLKRERLEGERLEKERLEEERLTRRIEECVRRVIKERTESALRPTPPVTPIEETSEEELPWNITIGARGRKRRRPRRRLIKPELRRGYSVAHDDEGPHGRWPGGM